MDILLQKYKVYTIPKQKYTDKLSYSNSKVSVTQNLLEEAEELFQTTFCFPELFIPQGDAAVYTQSRKTSSEVKAG